MSLADAGGRMMYSYKELAELAGYTTRVYSLLSVLHSLHVNEFDGPKEAVPFALTNIQGKIKLGEDGIKFENVPIVTPAPGKNRQGELLVENLNVHIRSGEHMLVTGPNGVGKTAVARVIATLWPTFGTFNFIFVCLFDALDLKKINLTYLFILKNIEGTLSRPDDRNIFYIPQRPYLSMGSLRDQ